MLIRLNSLDNALVTQSRLILLDTMLLLFCVQTVYCWVKFYKNRHQYVQFYLSTTYLSDPSL